MKKFLHHLFLPRESNNHRAKLLHHDSLLLVITLLLFISVSFSVVHNTHPQVLGISTNISVQDLLSLTNQKRQEKGLPPLQLNTELSQAADQKAHDMFGKNYWAHIAPDGTTPWYFIKNSGYEYLYAGENLARGFTTASDVVNAWMNSPSHRENMLSKNYSDIGFAILPGTLTGSDTILVVQMFGTRYSAKNESEKSTLAVAISSPTPTIFPSVSPTIVPILSQVKPSIPQSHQPVTTAVASVQNQPLFDSKSMTRDLGLFLLGLFIVILVVDAIIIERKKIARVVAHNLDHILFFTILLLAAILIGKGFIL